jgi:23S rRNA (guanosine2251-2'-O)-methyltransferase
MPSDSYEIRLCASCGLRYPLTEGHAFGARCPACMGETRVILRRQLVIVPVHDLPDPFTRKGAKTVRNSREERRKSMAVLLDNIRSAWNVGSILRSADGFGFDHAYCCGITPTPENEAVTKTSLGAEDSVTWSHHKDAVKLVKGLKKEGWKVYALEEDERAIKIQKKKGGKQRSVLIVGNEVTGVDPELLDLCDAIYFIPMRGEKKSFNVAIAFGIAAFALR